MITNQRFSDAMWASVQFDDKITIGGLGGIGHGLALQLGAYDHDINLYDMDVVEPHNCIPQGYRVNQIGLTKAEATMDDIYQYYRHERISSYTDKISRNSLVSTICFACFDNMEARRSMFESWKSRDDRKLFVDGRLLAEYFQVYFVQLGMEDRYESTLFSDSEVEMESCTYKQTKHVSTILHAHIISMFNLWKLQYYKGLKLRNIPFLSTYDARILNWSYES